MNKAFSFLLSMIFLSYFFVQAANRKDGVEKDGEKDGEKKRRGQVIYLVKTGSGDLFDKRRGQVIYLVKTGSGDLFEGVEKDGVKKKTGSGDLFVFEGVEKDGVR